MAPLPATDAPTIRLPRSLHDATEAILARVVRKLFELRGVELNGLPGEAEAALLELAAGRARYDTLVNLYGHTGRRVAAELPAATAGPSPAPFIAELPPRGEG